MREGGGQHECGGGGGGGGGFNTSAGSLGKDWEEF